MKAEQSAGAASGIPPHWREIDWRWVSRDVRRLQVRIVKAVEMGRWGKVRALQRLLATSRSGKLLAVRRVTENQGRKTPGVDGESWDTPEKKMGAVSTLRGRGYRPLPLRRIYIPKSNSKLRPLGIPTMKDRAMQALHLLALDPVAETTADHDSYGFRTKRRCADAMSGCLKALARRGSSPWVLEGDIRGCFDNISHDWLLAHVPMDRVILRKWLKAGYMEKQALHATEQGTPQGGIISPVLANLALDGLGRRLRERYPERGKGSENGRKAKVHLIRYADDFVITGRTKELLEDEVKPLVESFLRERGLELSAEKTEITHIEAGFDFLGQNVRRYSHGKLWIKPSKKNIHTFLEKVRSHVKKAQAEPAWRLTAELNLMIRGWAMYHRYAKSKRIFSSVDCAIFKALWRWARKGIAVTRSFGAPVTSWQPMREAIASYATRAAEKMRRYKVAAEDIFVFMHTSTFNNDPFYSNGASARFAETTNDTGEVVSLAVRLGERLWKDGFRYSKCGVMITELLPETIRQPALWGELDRDRRERAWEVMDKFNATLGRNTVRILGAGPKDAAWKLRAEYRSPRWTTRWDELPRIKAGSVVLRGEADAQRSEGRWPVLA